MALFATSIFSSAFLLFLVQPLVSKMALPRFGGSPAVWTTNLLLSQGLLLGGYLYSHVTASRMAPRRQMILHALLLLVPLVALPPAIAATGGSDRWPIVSLLGALGAAIGLPFFVLSTNATLVQRWYALATGREPYFLYGASNAGSLISLLAYPFLVEPFVGLRAQTIGWSVAYLGFVAATAACMAATWKKLPDGSAARPAPETSSAHVPQPRLLWVFRAFVPSLLLLAVSLRIATDIAAVPLLWVLPLAIYLGSWILAFLPRVPFPRERLELFAMVFILVALAGSQTTTIPTVWFAVALPLTTLFLGCWICHADLARDRPPPDQLTGFYLLTAVGGLLGGLVGNVLAPVLFDSIAEYPLAHLLLAVALALGSDRGAALRDDLRRKDTWIAAAAMAGALALWAAVGRGPGRNLMWSLTPLGLLLVGLIFKRRPSMFVFASTAATFAVLAGLHAPGRILDARRSFFGVMRVLEQRGEHVMVHGTTMHGSQRLAPQDAPPSYVYHPAAPLARVMALRPSRIGVVGLGAGALAALAGPGQTVIYYEIDPVVEPMARRWFTYLEKSRARVEVVLGDARLTLRDAPPASFDALIIDAFSSDAIPVHLLTVEAMRLYLERVAPGGLLVMHISNRHLDLARAVRGLAGEVGLKALIRRFAPDEKQFREEGARPTHVVALARDDAPLAPLRKEGWEPLGDGPRVVWTDDRSSLLELLLP